MEFRNVKFSSLLKGWSVIFVGRRSYSLLSLPPLNKHNQTHFSEKKECKPYNLKNKEAIHRHYNKLQRNHQSQNLSLISEQRKEEGPASLHYIQRQEGPASLSIQRKGEGPASRKEKGPASLYYIQNKAAVLEYQRHYNAQNKHRIQQYQRNYRIHNGEHLKKQYKSYYQTRKEAIKMNVALYRRFVQELEWEKWRLRRGRHRVFLPRLRNWDLWEARKENVAWRSSPLSVPLFLGYALRELHVRDPMDWYRISYQQICQLGGVIPGSSLYVFFGNLGKVVPIAYPEVDWDEYKFSRTRKKSTQRWLKVVLQQILPPDTLILEDYLHPNLTWDETNRKMELDIWVPELKLALEYQGEHHYNPNAIYQSLSIYKDRDATKQRSCEAEGIHLITIPYWWDRTKESLAEILSTSQHNTTKHTHQTHMLQIG
eukprot:TRINITY_DN3740_c0_g2_i2.p1 TRINITY_DN3740_c0_g2~~TRINITY_DN3740_c0_g2_i2.p1  ORF type:complete len:428 (-),score=80.89 TRINITY_DN3740_c0_g2_i2:77-1360(-)